MTRRLLLAALLAGAALAATARAGSRGHGRAGVPDGRDPPAQRGRLRPLLDAFGGEEAEGEGSERSASPGIKIENDGCGDFEVEIDGADTQADRSSFATEARKAGFIVTFEQTAPPMEFRQGQVVGIFASKRTLAEANALMQRLARSGWLYIDIARSATRWLVVMPQVPVKHALPIAHEVATAGFHIAFRPGVEALDNATASSSSA